MKRKAETHEEKQAKRKKRESTYRCLIQEALQCNMSLVRIVDEYADELDRIMWRRIGLRGRESGHLLIHDGPCLRTDVQFHHSSYYDVCPLGCYCIQGAPNLDHYRNKEPPTLEFYKMSTIQQDPYPWDRRRAWPWDRTIVFYIRPKQQRGRCRTSLSDDFIYQNYNEDVDWIDLDTEEILFPDKCGVGGLDRVFGCVGHNCEKFPPVEQGQHCNGAIMRAIFAINLCDPDNPQWGIRRKIAGDPQCWHCNTKKDDIDSHNRHMNKEWTDLDFWLHQFGLDNPIETLHGTMFVSIA